MSLPYRLLLRADYDDLLMYNRFSLLPCPVRSVLIQEFKDVAVDEATFKEMDERGDLLFGQLPMMEWGTLKLTERAFAKGATSKAGI